MILLDVNHRDSNGNPDQVASAECWMSFSATRENIY